ncbi:MAG: hypothetical protein FD145_251 [Candidatus Saganbacteria bacterium]|uniref:V-type ATP synthase subunit F n=1 Tax=Candidatus Saganbacteria bacterium TaxID=2575572 RepID=A0A833L298_UNCSA|nr:MAG: hypothetical protein FD145_251 [Candidatus Saganbacteria bacterium]
MSKIALIGPSQMVLPLASSGIEIFPADSGYEAGLRIEAISEKNEYAVVFITERLAMDCMESIELNQGKINFVFIPDNQGSVGLFFEKTNKLVKEAIGVSQND